MRVCKCSLNSQGTAATGHLRPRPREGARPRLTTSVGNTVGPYTRALGQPTCAQHIMMDGTRQRTQSSHASLASLHRGEGALSGGVAGGEKHPWMTSGGLGSKGGVARPGDARTRHTCMLACPDPPVYRSRKPGWRPAGPGERAARFGRGGDAASATLGSLSPVTWSCSTGGGE